MSYQGRIGAIGTETHSSSRTSFSSDIKKKKPEDYIGNLMNGAWKGAWNGVGSMINNLPNNFNSAFTVGQGANVQGAFGD